MLKDENVILDDKTISEIVTAENDEQVKAILETNNVHVTDEQISILKENFRNELSKLSKADDALLGATAGGAVDFQRWGKHIARDTGTGGKVSMWVGAGVGAAAGIVDASLAVRRGEITSSWEFVKYALKVSLKAAGLGAGVGAGLGAAHGAFSGMVEEAE